MIGVPSLGDSDIEFRVFQNDRIWSGKMRTEDHFQITVVREGSCWLECSDLVSEPIELVKGDVVGIVGRTAQLWRDSGGRPRGPAAEMIFSSLAAAPAPVASATRLLFGTADLRTSPSLLAFPRFFHITPGDAEARACLNVIFDLIEREAANCDCDRDDVIRRATEILLIILARQAASQSPDTGMLGQALIDPKVLRAIKLIETEAARNWTVESLASEVGMGRSAFAVRFRELVGDTPVNYLFKTRMRVASAMICSRGKSIAAVAEAIGYQSESAFSKAFVRHFGMTASQYRAAANDHERKYGRTRWHPARGGMRHAERPEVEAR